jgi:hypothetical protein
VNLSKNITNLSQKFGQPTGIEKVPNVGSHFAKLHLYFAALYSTQNTTILSIVLLTVVKCDSGNQKTLCSFPFQHIYNSQDKREKWNNVTNKWKWNPLLNVPIKRLREKEEKGNDKKCPNIKTCLGTFIIPKILTHNQITWAPVCVELHFTTDP